MITRRQFMRYSAGALVGLATVPAYAVGVEPMRVAVTRYQVRPSNWPGSLRLTLAVLADPHACHPWMSPERIAGLTRVTNDLGADCILLLGDYVAGHRWVTQSVPADEWAGAFGGLRAPLGVHAVLGNHDWWDDLSAQRVGHGPIIARRALEKAGIPVYENQSVRLTKTGQDFWLAGLGDQMALRAKRGSGRRYRGVDDLSGTLAQVTGEAPIILLAHEPDVFHRVPARVALTVSGHTHGGQIRLMGYSPVVPSRYGNRFAYGHVQEGSRHLIISGGLGCSIAPVRLGLPPEIVLVELSA
jgi:uncharacterized protein